MKALVSGATGYIGHSIAMALARRGYVVHVLVRDIDSKKIPNHPLIKICKGDITQKETIFAAMQGCDTVFHVAGLVQLCASKPESFYTINVEGTRNMLDVAVLTGVKAFVFTSTVGVIGPSLQYEMTEENPRVAGFNNDYELSKFLAEKLVTGYAELGLHTSIAAISKVFGPGNENEKLSVNAMIRRFITGKVSFCPNPATFIANYVFIEDVVEGHILLAKKARAGEKYILGGDNVSFNSFFTTIKEISGMRSVVLPVSKKIAGLYGSLHYIGKRMFGKEPLYNNKSVTHIYCNKAVSSAKAIKELGYHFTPFEEAMRLTIQSLKMKIYEYNALHIDHRVQ